MPRLLTVLALAFCVGCGDGPSPPSETSTPASQATTPALPASPTNDVLLKAASPFEDLAEFAEAGDEAGMDRAIAAYHREGVTLHDLLSTEARQRLDGLTTTVEQARASGDYHTVAANAVEAYRVLIEALEREALVVPAEVSLMDYAGFRLGVQARAAEPDWNAMRATTDEARRFWTSIKPDVGDVGLRDAVDTAVRGMEQATRTEDLRLAAFAAQVDLDLVDLLEHYFEQTRRGA